MSEPRILEPSIRNDDDSGFWVYGFGKGIKEGSLYLRVLLFFRRNYPTEQGDRATIAYQAGSKYVIFLRRISTSVNGNNAQRQLTRQKRNNTFKNQRNIPM